MYVSNLFFPMCMNRIFLVESNCFLSGEVYSTDVYLSIHSHVKGGHISKYSPHSSITTRVCTAHPSALAILWTMLWWSLDMGLQEEVTSGWSRTGTHPLSVGKKVTSCIVLLLQDLIQLWISLSTAGALTGVWMATFSWRGTSTTSVGLPLMPPTQHCRLLELVVLNLELTHPRLNSCVSDIIY